MRCHDDISYVFRDIITIKNDNNKIKARGAVFALFTVPKVDMFTHIEFLNILFIQLTKCSTQKKKKEKQGAKL